MAAILKYFIFNFIACTLNSTHFLPSLGKVLEKGWRKQTKCGINFWTKLGHWCAAKADICGIYVNGFNFIGDYLTCVHSSSSRWTNYLDISIKGLLLIFFVFLISLKILSIVTQIWRIRLVYICNVMVKESFYAWNC